MTTQSLDNNLRVEKLSLFGYNILNHCRVSAQTIPGLYRALGSTVENVTARVAYLVKLGLVVKGTTQVETASKGRRTAINVSITPKGLQTLERLEA